MNQSADIVCIGWGSLVWRPESLPMLSDWFQDGPMLPVEFARQSQGGLITLVLCPGATRVPTRWAVLDVPDMQVAQRALALREWSEALDRPKWVNDNIGCWEQHSGRSRGAEADTIAAWASDRGFAGAVWTSLPCKFNGQQGAMPKEDDVIEALRSLSANERVAAEEYVRKAPHDVNTPYRRRIVREFGWG